LGQIARKAIKECAYHAQYSAEWIIRLGDGTEESQAKVKASLAHFERFAGEFFVPSAVDAAAAENGWGPHVENLYPTWLEKVNSILTLANVPAFNASTVARTGGKTGIHSEYHGYILAEMQSLARAYPDASW
jgi:ring-1,2-phenylacetyl-CoA epoxidase subunit PaaC